MADHPVGDESSEGTSPRGALLRSWNLRTIAAAIIIVAVVVGATVWIAGDDAFELIDSERSTASSVQDDTPEPADATEPTTTTPTTTPVVADSTEATDVSRDTCVVETSPTSWQDEVPRPVLPTLADEPALEWRQVDSPFDRFAPTSTQPGGGNTRLRFLSGFHTTEDGRVAVVAQGDKTAWLEMTSDGIEWEAFALPQNIQLKRVHISDDRWIVVGPSLNSSDAEADPWAFHRVLLSDDRGATWTGVPLDPGTPPFFSDQYLNTLDLLVSTDRILLAAAIFPNPQLGDLLADRGLVERAAGVERSGFGDRSVRVLMPSDDPEGGYTRAEFSYSQLELSERQETVMDLWQSILRSGQLGYVRVFVGDASGLAVTGDFDFDTISNAATGDGFMLAVPAADQDGEQYVASPDGRHWSEVPVDPPLSVQFTGTRNDGSMWALIPWDGRFSTIAAFRCGRGPRVTAILEGLIIGRPGDPGLSAGAGGLVAVAAVVPEFRSIFEVELLPGFPGFPEGRVTRQGYELRLGEPERGLTLWDVAQNAAILEWNDFLRAGTPPWLYESGIDDDYELTITDPVDGQELVAFSMADLAEFIDPLRLIASRSVSDPAWIGWSTDGVDWNWQTALDAFGFEPSRFDIEMVVGDGFVLASVQDRGKTTWYVAEVP